MNSTTVSIIISSYNYGAYLRQAIQSALEQTHPRVEVIVVDDGSTDDSLAVAKSFGPRVTVIAKTNQGQASAINAGFRASRGEVVLLLDSDDFLLPTAAERAAEALVDASVSKAHWHMWEVNAAGDRTGKIIPPGDISDGDLRDAVIRDGPDAYHWPPTSGNVWSRQFLERVLPIPESEFTVCPDVYLNTLAPMFGTTRAIEEPQSAWRTHGLNNTWALPFEKRIAKQIERWNIAADALAQHCRRANIPVDIDRWRRNTWLYRVVAARDKLLKFVPDSQAFILNDDDNWGVTPNLAGRRCIPFLERDGKYFGSPADDDHAIAELERLRADGANFFILTWAAFWWREHYGGFIEYLTLHFQVLLDDDDLLILDLRERKAAP